MILATGIAIGLILGAAGGAWYGIRQGFRDGYREALADQYPELPLQKLTLARRGALNGSADVGR